MSLRVEVQRCPAVPTAPKTVQMMVVFILAEGVTIIALFPPSSNRHFPKRLATVFATERPIAVDPVADNSEIR